MNLLILTPPIAFFILAGFFWLQYKGLSIFSLGEKWKETPGKLKPYACGEDVKEHRVRPDYSQFFSFAFFFTIMHVLVLLIATIPGSNLSASIVASVFVMSAFIAVSVLFRR